MFIHLYINGNKKEAVPKINVPVKSVNNDIICANNKCTAKLEPKSVMKALFVYKNIHLIGKSIKFRQETQAAFLKEQTN